MINVSLKSFHSSDLYEVRMIYFDNICQLQGGLRT